MALSLHRITHKDKVKSRFKKCLFLKNLNLKDPGPFVWLQIVSRYIVFALFALEMIVEFDWSHPVTLY